MLGTMNYTRKVPQGDGYIDALFEDSHNKLAIQIPASHMGCYPYNPFEQTEDVILEKGGFCLSFSIEVSHSSVVI